jgi:hypothetical protein
MSLHWLTVVDILSVDQSRERNGQEDLHSDAKTYLKRVRAADSGFITATVNKATAYSYFLSSLD